MLYKNFTLHDFVSRKCSRNYVVMVRILCGCENSGQVFSLYIAPVHSAV